MLQWLRWWNRNVVPPSQATRTVILLPPATPDSSEQPGPVVLEHPPVVEVAPTPPTAVEPVPEPIHTPVQKEVLTAVVVEPAALPEPTPPIPPTDWRGPAYFLPGAYTLRWGIQPVLQASRARSLPPAKYPASVPAQPVPAQPARETATQPPASTSGAFPFLLANDSASGMRVDPVLFTEFLITREEELSPAAAHYWTDRAILDPSRTLTEKLLHIESPLTPAQLLAETAQPDAALALVVCHNVARAFARGSTILKRKRTAPSFYRYFDPNSLGAVDPGDWYRFFAIASIAAFASRGSIERSSGTPNLTALQIDSLAQQFPASTDDRRYAALAWANAIQFWEWGIYSRVSQLIRNDARQSLDAFRFGLRAISVDASGPWRWSVPKPASLNPNDARLDASASLLEIQEAA